MTKLVFLDRKSLSDSTVIKPPAAINSWVDYPATTADQVIERCRDANIAVLSKVPINKEVLNASPQLKHIAIAATGYNIVDIEACSKRGISVSNIPSYASTSVAEHVISLSLCLRRQLLQYRQQVLAGAWQKSDSFCLFDKPIHDLADATMGIVGFGELGQATGRIAHALGMRVIFSARKPVDSDLATQVEFNALLETADIISLHCSLNDSTRNLISTAEFDRMQNHAILINTARGGIVDEDALVAAIEGEQIGGAGVDVLVMEPPTEPVPLASIAERSNVIITPHSAWMSEQAMQTLANILLDNINAFLNGKPQNLVTQHAVI